MIYCRDCGKQITKKSKSGLCRSCSHKGQIPWMKGKHHTEKAKQKQREANEGKHHTIKSKLDMSKEKKGNKNPFYKKTHTEKSKQLMSEAKIGVKRKTRSKEHKRNLSIANKGQIPWMKGKHHTEKAKQKNRIAATNNMINNKWHPFFNKTSMQYFDILNRTIFKDGLYGVNEYCIPELGYWPDFISHNHKTIIEYDEAYHNRQIEKDAIRQQQIQSHYIDYSFIRIAEEDAKVNILANIFAGSIV